LTFSPLPVMFFNKKIKNYRLVSEVQKFKLFKKYGVDFVINIQFNRIFSKITAEKFIKNIIFKKINPRLIFVSNNFKFGNKRKGNVHLLKKFRRIKIFTQKDKVKFVKNLNNIGYCFSVKKKSFFIKTVKAFQRRYRKELINGLLDKECLIIAQNLSKKIIKNS